MNYTSKVFVVGADYHGEWTKDVYTTFRELGIDAELIYTNTLFGGRDSSKDVSSRAFIEKIKEFFRQNAHFFFEFIKKVRRQMSERTLVAKITAFHTPGKKLLILFIWTPPSVSLLKRIKKEKDIILVMWQGEPPVRDLKWAPSFPYFDHIFIVDEEWIPLFDEALQKRMTFLPLASSPATHFPLKENERDKKFVSQIACVGYYRPERAETLSVLKDYDLKIYGYWWEPGMERFPWLKKRYYGPASNEVANQVFNGTEIAIGNFTVPSSFNNNITQRVFDVSLVGNFQLSSYSPAIPKLFGNSVPMFHNREELKTLVDYYLSHPEERQRCADEAHMIAMRDHTYASRVKALMKTLSEKGWM